MLMILADLLSGQLATGHYVGLSFTTIEKIINIKIISTRSSNGILFI